MVKEVRSHGDDGSLTSSHADLKNMLGACMCVSKIPTGCSNGGEGIAVCPQPMETLCLFCSSCFPIVSTCSSDNFKIELERKRKKTKNHTHSKKSGFKGIYESSDFNVICSAGRGRDSCQLRHSHSQMSWCEILNLHSF